MTELHSVTRAVDVMLMIATHPQRCATGTEIASRLNSPVSTTHHLLATLQQRGMLSKDANRAYHLGSAIGILANSYLREISPPEPMASTLKHLAVTTGESCYISGWRNGEITILASCEGSHAVRVSELHTGYNGMAHARASGKLLLAHLSSPDFSHYLQTHPLDIATSKTINSLRALEVECAKIRSAGYALDDEEFKEGVACVSAPVFQWGELVSVYTVSAPVERFRSTRDSLIASVKATAASLYIPPRITISSERDGPRKRKGRPRKLTVPSPSSQRSLAEEVS